MGQYCGGILRARLPQLEHTHYHPHLTHLTHHTTTTPTLLLPPYLPLSLPTPILPPLPGMSGGAGA